MKAIFDAACTAQYQVFAFGALIIISDIKKVSWKGFLVLLTNILVCGHIEHIDW